MKTPPLDFTYSLETTVFKSNPWVITQMWINFPFYVERTFLKGMNLALRKAYMNLGYYLGQRILINRFSSRFRKRLGKADVF